MAFTKRDIDAVRAARVAREAKKDDQEALEPVIVEEHIPIPHEPPPRRPRRFLYLRPLQFVRLVFTLFILWYFFGGGLEHQAARGLQDLKEKVAVDQVKEYEIAKRNGSAMDACVMAGMVAAAYLQSQEERSYQRWKDIERSDCALAGLSR
jgi:hypothetical protein